MSNVQRRRNDTTKRQYKKVFAFFKRHFSVLEGYLGQATLHYARVHVRKLRSVMGAPHTCRGYAPTTRVDGYATLASLPFPIYAVKQDRGDRSVRALAELNLRRTRRAIFVCPGSAPGTWAASRIWVPWELDSTRVGKNIGRLLARSNAITC